MNTVQELKEIEEAILKASSTGTRATAKGAQVQAQTPTHASLPEPIAIIGLSGFFPKSSSVDEFWRLLDQDVSLIEEIPSSRFDWRTFYDPTGKKAGQSRSKWGGFIPDIAGFDPAFFNILPGEAVTMDPRQRLLLMSAYQTLADAGYSPESLKQSKTGVFVAIQDNEYLQLLKDAGVDTGEWYAQTCLLANRISYFFDFRGASEVVDAQCPGAAVAIHRAVNALRSGEIGQALVGAANLLLRPEPFSLLSDSGQLSPTDSVNSFGLHAQGHLRAEGVASLLLKPLSKALADKDSIYALIKNTAVNYNGQGGASIAAPNTDSHVELIKTCYRQVNIDPRQVRYIEAQGMGNVLADLVEWQAFNRALKDMARQQQVSLAPGMCRISTVKPMMGHMESASALGALFKVVRSMQTGVIHKIVNFTDYHPDMDREDQPCTLATETAAWPRTNGGRLAGVHCYGMGGINAHLLIEEYDRNRHQHKDAGQNARAEGLVSQGESPVLIVLSAKSEPCLTAMASQLYQFLGQDGQTARLADIAFTLQVGREALEHRIAWVIQSQHELVGGLNKYLGSVAETDGEQSVYRGHAKDAPTRRQPPLTGDNLHALAAYWVHGGSVSWTSLYSGKNVRRVRLPVYPFDKQHYWIRTDDTADTSVCADDRQTGERRIRDYLVSMLGAALQLPPGKINPEQHLYDFGIDSIIGMKLLRGLARTFDLDVQGRDMLEYPTIQALSRYLGQQLNRQPEQQFAGSPAVPELPQQVTGQAQRFPLSEGQKGLWTLQKLVPDMSAYNIPLCFRIAQSVDADALKKACRFLLDRHPMLAGGFVEQDGAPVRETRPEPVLAFEQQDVSALASGQLLARISAIARIPFELDSGPLVRFHLFSRGRRDNYLLLTLHHIVFDGGSFLPVVGALLNAYQQISQGKTPIPAEAANHYPDFVQWEQKMLSGAEGHKHRAYWMQQLAGKLPGLNLFTDYPRAASSRFEGRTHSIRLDSALSGQIRAFARQQRMNLSTLFLALFNVLLHRYTGQDDIIVGMPEKGRSQDRFENEVGYFINMLPIRSRELGQKPFAALIRELQLTMTDALDHAAYPFPVMVSDLGIAPSEDFAPVFQVAFEYQNVFSAGDLLTFQRQFQDALSITLIEEIAQEGEYELVLEVREGKDDFALNLKYNPTLFKPSTIARLAEHLVNLAGQAIAQPQQLPAELGMLADQEQKRLLYDWNNTATDYPTQQCFHQLFEQQARLTPNAVAVVFEHQQLSYAELDQKSTQLAKYLQQAGVEPDQLVVVCVDRSIDMMVALLGVAKAGAAWLPMEPRYPDERLGFMLQDGQALMVLTQSAFQQKLQGIAAKTGRGDFPVISLDSQWDDIERQAQRGDLRQQANADHLAYVIYTSGSTGAPKGVMIRHQSLTNFLLSMAEEPGLKSSDRLLAVTTYCFDIAALELLLPLVRGGCCCICATDKLNDSERLQQEIKRLQPTVMQATPSTWTMLFHGGWRNQEGVKILCGGEPLPQELKQYFAASGSEAWNMYGPTETTIWSTVARITKDEPINIGKPIANTQVYIVDSNNRLAPIGLPGELCIGGDGLAKGYLNNPGLTAEKFIDNPLKPGSRLYRTGDLARRREDGVLEHMGRLDHQVKIRGYRIELGEIESWLNRHPAIRQSVVVAREQQGGKQLVAYYVKHSDQDLPQAQLQNYLSEQLPDYMVPAIFVAVPEIPLMANGKTDRNALASREPVIERKDSYVPPQSEIERAVLAIWQALLNIGTIGVTDGFFELGGNSVLS
ncbi:MAG: amino acid adenylation domain-containing protein, partial [Methylobacter sp.]|nr:amino acid adenylation domain-containing protein [Methylobacter sp.]